MATEYRDRYESITLRFTPEEFEAIMMCYEAVKAEAGPYVKISKHGFVKSLVRFGLMADGVEVVQEV